MSLLLKDTDYQIDILLLFDFEIPGNEVQRMSMTDHVFVNSFVEFYVILDYFISEDYVFFFDLRVGNILRPFS